MPMSSSRRARRGLTLVEVMVGTSIAIIMTTAAVIFATQETRLMDVSRDKLRSAQEGRAAMALLADDLRKAGAGVGYAEDGTFLGLMSGSFTVAGLGFNSQGAANPAGASDPGVYEDNTMTRVDGTTYVARTHDIGVRFADGAYATIIDERAGQGLACSTAQTRFQTGELVLLRDQTGISAQMGTITPGAVLPPGGSCTCVGGCLNFTFNPTDPTFSGPAAASVRFGFGEIQGGMSEVAWFVTTNANGVGELRRMEAPRDGTACAARNQCGGVVAFEAEALHTRVWRYDPTAGAWVTTAAQAVDRRNERIRVDVELILRSDDRTTGYQPEVQSRLWPGQCYPAPCGQPDNYRRTAFRTSVEVMNSGIMEVR